MTASCSPGASRAPASSDQAVDDAAVLVDRERAVLLAAGDPEAEPDDPPDPDGTDRQDQVELVVQRLAAREPGLSVGARVDPPALRFLDLDPLVERRLPLLGGQPAGARCLHGAILRLTRRVRQLLKLLLDPLEL